MWIAPNLKLNDEIKTRKKIIENHRSENIIIINKPLIDNINKNSTIKRERRPLMVYVCSRLTEKQKRERQERVG